MCDKKIKNYQLLNEIAEENGIVVFGGASDTDIPLCELKQAFALESDLYNRSISGLSVNTAADLDDTCAAPLHPEMIFLHIGEADRDFFGENASEFDRTYRELIGHISSLDRKCAVVILSLKNPAQDPVIGEMNRHLKYIADSERCEFGDVAAKRVWNPKETRDVVSFVYSTGFVRPLTEKRPVYDLVKILFCCDAVTAE